MRKITLRIGKGPLRCGALALCMALVFGSGFGQLGQTALLAATSEDKDNLAYKDTADQIAAGEAAKELFTLEQVRDLSRSRGAETLKAKTDLAMAQASKDAADMKIYDAWYLMVSLTAMGEAEAAAEAAGAYGKAIVGKDQAVTSLDDAKATLESQMETAIYNSENLFFSYLQMKDSLAALEKTIDLSREQWKIEELKVNIGLSTQTEVKKKALALDDLLDKKQSLINGIDMTGRSLMRQMGKDDGLVFRLDPAFSIEGMKDAYDPDQLADLAVKNNLNLGVLNRSIDDTKDMLEADMAYSEKSQIGAKADSIILTRDNLIKNMRTLARSTATGLASAKTELALLEKTVEEKQTAYDLMTLQVSLGLAPKIGLAASELEWISAKNDLLKAQQNYYLSLRKAALLVKGVAIASGSGSGAA